MNTDFEEIKSILLQLKSEYIIGVENNNIAASMPITERDIVAEIYHRLRSFCIDKKLSTHCEIKPAPSILSDVSVLKNLPRIDNVILKDIGEKTWISHAINLQDKYKKGLIEARFSSIPIEFFHTAIEVKIQSNIRDAKKDIDKLKVIQDINKDCNCVFILLNARGKTYDHDSILSYAKRQNIFSIEYTCNKNTKPLNENRHVNQRIINDKLTIPRRQRIIDLIRQNNSDEKILDILDKEYPSGTFETTNAKAIYGTKHDKRIQW